MNATEKETRGVPFNIVAEAEAEFRRAREVARIANERYRQIRDHVTYLRKRRAAYEARQKVCNGRGISLEGGFADYTAKVLAAIANGLGLPPHVLRDAQSQSGATPTRQVGDWERYRPDPAAGEPGPPSEV